MSFTKITKNYQLIFCLFNEVSLNSYKVESL